MEEGANPVRNGAVFMSSAVSNFSIIGIGLPFLSLSGISP